MEHIGTSLYEDTADEIKKYVDLICTLNKDNLSDYVLGLPKSRKKVILNDIKIKENFMLEKNHYPFVWLIQGLKDDEFNFFCDQELIELLIKDPRLDDKLNAILTCENTNKNIFLTDNRLMEKICDSNSLMIFIWYENFTIQFGEALFNYLLINSKDGIYKVNKLSDKVVSELISNPKNIEKIIKKDLVESFLRSASFNTIQGLIEIEEFRTGFLKLGINTIDNALKEGLKLPPGFLRDKLFIEKYLQIDDINEYRTKINNLKNHNSAIANYIEEKRKLFYKKQIYNFNKTTNLIPKYQEVYDSIEEISDLFTPEFHNKFPSLSKNLLFIKSKDELLSALQEFSSKQLFEMTVDTFYEEIGFDFIKAVREIVEYAKSDNTKAISSDRYTIYQTFDTYGKLTIEDKIKFFNYLENKDNEIANFYDDFKNCHDESMIMANNSLFKTLKNNELKNVKLSQDKGVDIYELDGEPFKMIVTATRNRRDVLYKNHTHYKLETSSLSMIGDKNVYVFNDPNEYIILGFDEININRVMHVYEADSFTTSTYSSHYHGKLFTPDELLKNTHFYNEILYSNIDQNSKEVLPLTPSYVIAYKEVKLGDLSYAKLNNIPIVLLHPKKYAKNTNPNHDRDKDKLYDKMSGTINEDYYVR